MNKEDLRTKYERIHFKECDNVKGKLKQDYANWLENELINQLTLTDVNNNEVALKSFVEEYVEAFEDGQVSDTALYRQAKRLL